MNVSRRRLLSWLPAVAAIPAIPAIAKLRTETENPKFTQAMEKIKAEQLAPVVKEGEYMGPDLSRMEIDYEQGCVRTYDKKGVLRVQMGKLDTRA